VPCRAIAHEGAEGFEHRHAILAARRIHHTLQRIDAAKPHGGFLARELFEAFRYLVADQQVA
jgi:Mn-dependent DtxR family transcriptional regulator